jgi:hypothetical protein
MNHVVSRANGHAKHTGNALITRCHSSTYGNAQKGFLRLRNANPNTVRVDIHSYNLKPENILMQSESFVVRVLRSVVQKAGSCTEPGELYGAGVVYTKGESALCQTLSFGRCGFAGRRTRRM